jgi:polysaccharide export outer membrane protein
LGEPISVGGDDSWELTGEIEERGTNLVANLKGSDGVQAGFYRGTVKPERAVHVQGAIFSGGVYSMWFVVSTNTDSQPVLQRVEETGEPFTNHYTLVRPEKGAEWQLDKAWRADPQGRTVKEWPVTNPTTQKPLLLAPGDMLRLVSTSINDPLDHSEALIDPEGDVSLALHVKVHVAGLTLPEAAAVIQKAYQPSYFREWKFTVIRVPVAQLQPVPRGQAPSFVFTEGEFKNPGRYPWTNGMTLKDGIDAANGFTDYARRSLRIRHWDGSEERYRLGAGRTLTNNPALKPGDYVISPRAEW